MQELIDDEREAKEAEVEPHELAQNEGDNSDLVEDSSINQLRDDERKVCQVMHKNDECADRVHIAEEVADEKENSHNVVQDHLIEVLDVTVVHQSVQ